MKPLYILSGDDVRSRRADPDEIQEFIDDPSLATGYRQLGTVAIDDDGEIVTTPLTAEELRRLGVDYQADQVARLRKLLDDALAFRRDALAIRAVLNTERVVLWAERAPWIEDVVRAWSEDRRLRIEEEPIPAKAEHWIRTLYVHDGAGYDTSVVKIQWPSVRVGPDTMIVEGVARMSESIAAIGKPF